jgi:toxin ParE1/3/4
LKLRFSNQSLLDLEDIEVYGVLNFGLAASNKYMLRLKNVIDHLHYFPELARPHPGLKANARALPVGAHIVIYRFSDEHVDILRIVHHRRNWTENT